MYGSYMGFLEFDGKRYWDSRYVLPFRMKVRAYIFIIGKILKSQLESDCSKRKDLINMLKGDLKEA